MIDHHSPSTKRHRLTNLCTQSKIGWKILGLNCTSKEGIQIGIEDGVPLWLCSREGVWLKSRSTEGRRLPQPIFFSLLKKTSREPRETSSSQIALVRKCSSIIIKSIVLRKITVQFNRECARKHFKELGVRPHMAFSQDTRWLVPFADNLMQGGQTETFPWALLFILVFIQDEQTPYTATALLNRSKAK